MVIPDRLERNSSSFSRLRPRTLTDQIDVIVGQMFHLARRLFASMFQLIVFLVELRQHLQGTFTVLQQSDEIRQRTIGENPFEEIL